MTIKVAVRVTVGVWDGEIGCVPAGSVWVIVGELIVVGLALGVKVKAGSVECDPPGGVSVSLGVGDGDGLTAGSSSCTGVVDPDSIACGVDCARSVPSSSAGCSAGRISTGGRGWICWTGPVCGRSSFHN